MSSARKRIPDTVLGLPNGKAPEAFQAVAGASNGGSRAFTLTLPAEAYSALLARAQAQSLERQRRVGIGAVAVDLLLKALAGG